MSDQNNSTTAQKPWANPTPAGLVALAVACFCFFGLLTGILDKPGALPIIACWLFGGFVIQMVVALCDLKSGNLSGGNTFLYFSAFFMLVGAIEMMIKYFAAAKGWSIAIDARADGFAWAALALVVIMWTPAFFKGSSILFVLVLFLDIAVPLIAICDLKLVAGDAANVLNIIAGSSLLICGLLGIYLASAIVVNGTYGKNILPNPGPFYKEKK